MIRVVIAGEAAVVRAGLEAVIASSESLMVAASPVTLDALPPLIEQLRPDVVLVDLERDVDEDALASLAAPSSETEREAPALVVLAEEAGSPGIAELLRLGVRAVLPRTAAPAELVAAIEAAASRLVIIHPELVEALLAGPASRTSNSPNPTSLTPREIEVLTMLAEGLGNKTIARRLHISEHTVKFHISSIFSKLGATSRTEAVTLGIRQGLVLL